MKMLDWQLNDNYRNPEQYVGNLTLALDGDSIDSAQMQLAPFVDQLFTPDAGFDLDADHRLHYAGARPLAPAAQAMLGLERVLVYPAGFVCVVQLSGDYCLMKLRS